MISVLVADDQALVRAGLVALLNAAPGVTVVGEACDGHQAVTLATAARPGVILMDIRMPGLSGLAATRHILAGPTDPAPKIIVLTTFDLDEYVYEALRAGASGFILKETEPERLLAAIHTVVAGDMLFSPTVTRRLIEAYLHADAAPTTGALDSLTAREHEVVRLVATVQCGHSATPDHQRGHREDSCQPHHDQTGPDQPRPGRRARLRKRPDHSGTTSPIGLPCRRCAEGR